MFDVGVVFPQDSLPGAKIREVRPAVADAAVLTLEALPFERERLTWYDLALPERGVETGAQLDPLPAGLMASFATGQSVVELPEGSSRGGEEPAQVDPLSVGAFARVGSALHKVPEIPVARPESQPEVRCFVEDDLSGVSSGSSPKSADQERRMPKGLNLELSKVIRSESSATCRDCPSAVGRSEADASQSQFVGTSRSRTQSESAIHSETSKGAERKESRSGLYLMGVVAKHLASAAVVGMVIKIIC